MLCSMSDAFGFDSDPFEYGAPTVWDIRDAGDRAGSNEFHAAADLDFLGGTDSMISMDIFSKRLNQDGWGVYGADLRLVLEKDDEWVVPGAFDGAKKDDHLTALTWDETSWIDSVLDVGTVNSNMDFAWFSGTWEDVGLNNVYINNIVAIPEPATYGLITIFGGGILLFRRRFKM